MEQRAGCQIHCTLFLLPPYHAQGLLGYPEEGGDIPEGHPIMQIGIHLQEQVVAVIGRLKLQQVQFLRKDIQHPNRKVQQQAGEFGKPRFKS